MAAGREANDADPGAVEMPLSGVLADNLKGSLCVLQGADLFVFHCFVGR